MALPSCYPGLIGAQMATEYNSYKRMARARARKRSDYKSQEGAKLGTLRAGSTGIMDAEYNSAGSCHRKAHLRQLGIEIEQPELHTQIMWEGGTGNESAIYDLLIGDLNPGEIILREEEIPIHWLTSNGTAVTGRPDLVVCEPVSCVDEKSGGVTTVNRPIHVYEAKTINSVWVSRNVFLDGEPKIANLAQTAHYMWKLGCPGTLIYKQYGNQPIPIGPGERPEMFLNMFSKYKDKYADNLEIGDDGEIRHVKPFELIFELEFTGKGVLRYRRTGKGRNKWVETIITTQDIERYYQFISEMGPEQKLGGLFQTVAPDGAPKNYDECRKYCPLVDICKGNRQRKLKPVASYLEWLAAVRSKLDVASE